MFKSQIEAAEEGIKESKKNREHFAERIHFVKSEFLPEYTNGIRYWGNREQCFIEALAILKELQAEYRKHFGRFLFLPRNRNGHNVRLGLLLSARARLAPLEKRAGVVETGEEMF